MLVRIYTDGAARGNPEGPGGYGTILTYEDTKGRLHTREYSQGYVRTTNNRMELMAVIADAFNKHWVESWLKKNWKGSSGPVKNVDLWKRLLKAKEPHQVTFIWVKGHAGHPQNERCDALATSAADGENLLVDEGIASAP